MRFAPPSPGEYTYRLRSTDASNPDLNGHHGRVDIAAYRGANELLRCGMFRVSGNKRYFEHADGTPFYWLADTWWTGLSDRLPWEGFQTLTADRKAKGFTVIQIVGGLVPSNEELAPVDPGFCNEGGCVWDAQFRRINPSYFDHADRRIEHLLDNALVPAIVGAWAGVLEQMGVAKLKQHWRYLIARYGAYPVFWVVGGEVFDPPAKRARELLAADRSHSRLDASLLGGWSEIARYVRAIDPLHHPLTVHEWSMDDLPLQDEALTDFKLIQPSHYGWASIAVEVAQIGAHYARTAVRKPIVQGEIGYEKLGQIHLEDFQRTAFWLAMLNGAAGHTYGANGTWEAYTGDKPLHRWRHSFMSWEEGMHLPGSYQIGLGAKLLRQYQWWRFEPHPEWIAPRGTTFFEPRRDVVNEFRMDLKAERGPAPSGEWTARKGDFRLPYAAGIRGEVRVIYMPSFGIIPPQPPTIFALEDNVRYRAYYWEPSTGTKVELGTVARPPRGERIPVPQGEALTASSKLLRIISGPREENLVAAVDASGETDAGLVLCYHNAGNYIAAIHSPREKRLYLIESIGGKKGDALGQIPVPEIGPSVRLTAEVRNDVAIASISDGRLTYTTPIVKATITGAGGVGFLHSEVGAVQHFENFEFRKSSAIAQDDELNRQLRDAEGNLRGELRGAPMPIGPIAEFIPGYRGWDGYARQKYILLDAYLPERLPTAGDWLLVLEAKP